MHVLDNPVWHALAGPHATVAERCGDAARYDPEVTVFAALADQPAPDDWDALRDLVGPGGAAFFARAELSIPAGWTVHFVSQCRQMWLPGAPSEMGIGARAAADADDARLGVDDVRDMLALVERTRPGPFLTRTIELGTYVGVRDRDALVAMAGERLHPPGFTEISAVCTDSEHRGRGLASRLVRRIAHGILDRDETPFLHLTLENEAAHRVYAALGFETRRLLDVIGVRAPS